jgi:hypothetical protein
LFKIALLFSDRIYTYAEATTAAYTLKLFKRKEKDHGQ